MAAVVRSVGADFVNGAICTAYLKNPSNPKYANDAAVKRYKTLLGQYGPSGADPNNAFFFYGFAKAYDTVRAPAGRGQEPDAGLADGGDDADELGQPVHDQGRQGEDEHDGPLPALADQADPLHRPAAGTSSGR